MLDQIIKAALGLGRILLVVVLVPTLGITILIVLNMDWSRDDQLMREFKAPLIAFLDSDQERVTLSDLYSGTEFEGDTLCVDYFQKDFFLRFEDLTVFQRLNRMFPDMMAEIMPIHVTQKNPNLLVAIRRGKNLQVMSGNTHLLVGRPDTFGAFYVEGISELGDRKNRYIPRGTGDRCVGFKEGVLKRETSIKETADGDVARLYAVLTDAESPTQAEKQAELQALRNRKRKVK